MTLTRRLLLAAAAALPVAALPIAKLPLPAPPPTYWRAIRWGATHTFVGPPPPPDDTCWFDRFFPDSSDHA